MAAMLTFKWLSLILSHEAKCGLVDASANINEA